LVPLHELNYEAPNSVAEAVQILRQHGENARPLAGGTDIIIQMRAGVRRPTHLVDVKKIPELRQLSFDAKSGLKLGAAAPCVEVYENRDVQRHYPGLAEAAHLIGSLQIQNRAAVGGNLCNGSPAADTTPALIVLGAKARIAGPNGEREVAVEDFCVSPGRTVLQPGELLVQIFIPAPAPNSSDAYLRLIPRNEMDIAVVGAGVALTLDGDKVKAARVALAAVAPRPLFVPKAGEALVGKKLDDASIAAAARAAMDASTPIDDMRGTAEYRKHVVGVLTRRAIKIAAERARNAGKA
jgi:carbon-monoxide dehydrogenase medium subunit